MKTGLVLDPCFESHRTPPGHPERAERISVLMRTFQEWPQGGDVVRLAPVPLERELLRLVHTAEQVASAQSTRGIRYTALDADTSCSEDSFDVALLAAGSCLELTRQVLEGKLESGFAMVRPPGHHAESHRSMGFCLFNNVAIAAEWAVRQPGVDRVAIVDFDVHHGNGTQEIFYEREEVLYLSSHQHPLYPGTGSFAETGRAAGSGFNLNFPMPPGQDPVVYADLYRNLIGPVLKRFSPHMVFVSAGFDAHQADPLAGMNLDKSAFRELASILNAVASQTAAGRILYVLEGGYDLDALASSAFAVLSECVTHEDRSEVAAGQLPATPYTRHALAEIRKHSPHWAEAIDAF